MSHEKFQYCIDTCLECAIQCDHCASECLKESEVKMLTKCIQLERECAEMCFSTARMMTLGSEHSGDICQVCAAYCTRCAEECEKHAHMEHCKLCAEACRKCAEDCLEMAKQHQAQHMD
jgi:hypothetical protein